MTVAAEPTMRPRPAREGKLTQARVALSEWTKLRSVRSTRYSLAVAVLLTVGIPVLISFVVVSHYNGWNPNEKADWPRQRLETTLIGVQIAQLAIGVLGVLVLTAEYSTGMIRATLIAVPKRLPVLWAKAMVYGLVTFALMLPAVLVAFFASQAIRSSHELQIGFTEPGVVRAVIGSALYLVLIGLFGLGIGAIVRNTAGGIATFAAILFVLPPLLNVLPRSWNDAISPYMPSNAGGQIMSISRDLHSLSAWGGFALFCGYVAATLAIAAFLFQRRDA